MPEDTASPAKPSVPARYKGPFTVMLRDSNGYDQYGEKRATNLLSPGDVILLTPQEAYGYTIIYDKSGQRQPEFVGYGKVWKPEHDENFTDVHRSILGYEHHEGRSDFEPLDPVAQGVLLPKDGDPQPKSEVGGLPAQPLTSKASKSKFLASAAIAGDESYVKPDEVVEENPQE